MRSYADLFPIVANWENLLLAYGEARRGKRNRPEVLRFHQRFESSLEELRGQLLSGEWMPDPYREFVSFGEVKRRVIHAPTFRDRVVHHALVRIIGPLLEQKWIFDSYACRKGKGIHRAAKRVQRFLREGRGNYVLQLDISRYYPSMDHAVLLEMLGRTIRDERVMSLVGRMLDGFASSGVGIPIGALTSQVFANVYLNELDHFIKECMGVHCYVRYMDDMVLVGDKDALRGAWGEIRWLVEGALRLRLNPKSRLYPASHGVDFCGYRIWRGHMRPRKRTVRAAKRRFCALSRAFSAGRIDRAGVRRRVMSFLGYMQWCDGWQTAKSTLAHLVLKEGGTHDDMLCTTS